MAETEFIPCGNDRAPCIIFIDMAGHPFGIASAAPHNANVIGIKYDDWNDSLTPWKAPGLRGGDPDFGGHADETLRQLVEEIVPRETEIHGLSPPAYGIAGYSLGGLFSLYAFIRSGMFSAVSSMSGSLWYEGWIEYLRNLDFCGEGKKAFLSLGDREERSGCAILRTVRNRTEETAKILRSRGCETEVSIGSGTHFQCIKERLESGLAFLDDALVH